MIVAGVDEVGRGPLAGPVLAAAVILKSQIIGVTDSKKLTAKKRDYLSNVIKDEALCYAFGRVEAAEIDEINIHNATLLAMKRAIEALPIVPDKVLVDGIHSPLVDMACETIVKGDSKIEAIGAASIIAKVLRDSEMIIMDEQYPGYGFASHKGYPTKVHREALMKLGPCPIHRRSYAPVAAVVNINLTSCNFMGI